MSFLTRTKNRLLAAAITRFPSLSGFFVSKVPPLQFDETPWTELTKPLSQSRLALVTTAGVHLASSPPFDMVNPDGDPSWRPVPVGVTQSELSITHDYYDHSDADRDINIVFPLDRLRELFDEGRIGALADTHYGFMGHIDGPLVTRLVQDEAVAVATSMRDEGVDVALLTPG